MDIKIHLGLKQTLLNKFILMQIPQEGRIEKLSGNDKIEV